MIIQNQTLKTLILETTCVFSNSKRIKKLLTQIYQNYTQGYYSDVVEQIEKLINYIRIKNRAGRGYFKKLIRKWENVLAQVIEKEITEYEKERNRELDLIYSNF